MKQNISPLSGTPRPKREPLPRTWFMARGFKKADPNYTNGCTIWLHPHTNDVLGPYGRKLVLNIVPKEKHLRTAARYLRLTGGYGNMCLARLKYLTFIGDIPKGYTIDHINGDTFDNNILNLRAVPRAINDRDGGFLRKLRHKKIDPRMYSCGVLLVFFNRMAKFKAAHSERRYRSLTRDELLQILVGDDFTIDTRTTDQIMQSEMSRHQEY